MVYLLFPHYFPSEEAFNKCLPCTLVETWLCHHIWRMKASYGLNQVNDMDPLSFCTFPVKKKKSMWLYTIIPIGKKKEKEQKNERCTGSNFISTHYFTWNFHIILAAKLLSYSTANNLFSNWVWALNLAYYKIFH